MFRGIPPHLYQYSLQRTEERGGGEREREGGKEGGREGGREEREGERGGEREGGMEYIAITYLTLTSPNCNTHSCISSKVVSSGNPFYIQRKAVTYTYTAAAVYPPGAVSSLSFPCAPRATVT